MSLSGTATVPWALVDNAREKGLKLASSIGCRIDNGTEHTMECLKQRPAERLLRAVGQFIVSKLKFTTKYHIDFKISKTSLFWQLLAKKLLIFMQI